MSHTIQSKRIEMRVDSKTKSMAERASATLGCSSLTDYIVRLIHDNAPKVLEREISIRLTSTQFTTFLAACNDTKCTPSDRILVASKRLDTEGY